MNCSNKSFEEMTPLERKSSLEFKIAEFDPLRLMDNEISGGKFIISLEGDDDLGYKLVMYMMPINKYDDSDKRVVTHEHVAQRCNVNSLIMGGAEVRYGRSNLLFFGFSVDFGAIPEEVMKNFLPYLKDYIKDFDYERSDRVIQEKRSLNEQEYWKEQCEQVKTKQRIVEEQLRKRETVIMEKCNWWNRRKAKGKGITVEQYVAEEYAAELVCA